MRIHLPLQPEHFQPQPIAGPSSSPLVNIGGDLVLIELQGELSWEGDRSDKVIGVLGLERPDKPTLHLGEHHLLHGKITNLQKPYAVIRRVYGDPAVTNGVDELEHSEEEEDDATPQKRPRDKVPDDEEEDDEPPLFPPEPTVTPSHAGMRSSSPMYPPSAVRDYSSELDFSSPARWNAHQDDDEEEEEEQKSAEEVKKREMAKRKEKRKREEKERTRHYEVVGVVRKKVVFALRPEPIVTATVLPD